MSIILITGCSTGIGYATALSLSKKGHKVYATMRNPQSSPELQTVAEQQALPVKVLPLDVNSDESVEMTIGAVLKIEEHIDVLVNNAGISSLGAVEELQLDYFKSNMETNYFGTLRCIKAVLPSMRERKKGSIINVTSIAGRIYNNYHSAYCASKAAVEALSECLAQEVNPFGISVALVEPGVIETPIFLKGNELPKETNYPNIMRLVAFFGASLENHVQPDVVASVINNIIEDKSNQFRNTAGPDSAPLLDWRKSQSDEAWIASASIDEENWMNAMQAMGLNVNKFIKQKEPA